MRILGVDFTSRPSRRKPITCVEGWLDGATLHLHNLKAWPSFEGFDQALREPGPWISAIDFPFGQSRRFIENIDWPQRWATYTRHAERLGRDGFREALERYKLNRVAGDKEHRRATDVAARSISPQKLYGTPVALMFYEGAPRLIAAGVTVPGLLPGDPDRVAVEAYPGILARSLIGKRSYKQDTKKKQTDDQRQARRDILDHVMCGTLVDRYGLIVSLGELTHESFTDDPTGDNLDALLCCIQGAWAGSKERAGYGVPPDLDPLEGWIADPALSLR